LVTRQIAYSTLKGINNFEELTSQLKMDVHNYLENSPKEGASNFIKNLA